jgi:hypothetical protein
MYQGIIIYPQKITISVGVDLSESDADRNNSQIKAHPYGLLHIVDFYRISMNLMLLMGCGGGAGFYLRAITPPAVLG